MRKSHQRETFFPKREIQRWWCMATFNIRAKSNEGHKFVFEDGYFAVNTELFCSSYEAGTPRKLVPVSTIANSCFKAVPDTNHFWT